MRARRGSDSCKIWVMRSTLVSASRAKVVIPASVSSPAILGPMPSMRFRSSGFAGALAWAAAASAFFLAASAFLASAAAFFASAARRLASALARRASSSRA